LVIVERRRPKPTRRVRNIERPVDFDELDELDGADQRAGDPVVAAAVITAEQPVVEVDELDGPVGGHDRVQGFAAEPDSDLDPGHEPGPGTGTDDEERS
jgi:hypothetical protein